MTEVLVAVIGAIGLVLVAAIGARRNGRVKAIQEQVQNDHSTNLREELDHRHSESMTLLSTVAQRLVITDNRMLRVEDMLNKLAERIEDVEDTVQPRRKQ